MKNGLLRLPLALFAVFGLTASALEPQRGSASLIDLDALQVVGPELDPMLGGASVPLALRLAPSDPPADSSGQAGAEAGVEAANDDDTPSSSQAFDTADTSSTKRGGLDLPFSWTVDTAVSGVAGAYWLTTEYLLKDTFAPPACIWCDRDGELNPVDTAGLALRWGEDQTTIAARASDALVYLILPVGTNYLIAQLAHANGAPDQAWENVMMVIEAAVVAAAVNQTVKFFVGRERPFVAARTDADRQALHERDDNLSFYSGHASFAFALTSAALTVANLRGYEGSGLIWATAVPAAILVPYLRMAADRHYLTDVTVGMAMGALFGWGIPTLFHSPDGGERNVKLVPHPGGLGVVATF